MKNRTTLKLALMAGVAAITCVAGLDSSIAAEDAKIPNVAAPITGLRARDPAKFDSDLRALRAKELTTPKLKGTFKVVVAGDIIETYPFAQLADPTIQAVFKIIHSGDVAVANMESNVRDFNSAESGIGGLEGPKEIAADVRAQGWTLLQRASNHATDMGTVPMLENLKTFREAGIQVAGSGRNLQEARAPQFVQTPKGRVGLVGSFGGVVTAHQGAPSQQGSETDSSPVQIATYQVGFTGGIPGVNPLRLTKFNLVSEDELASIYKMAGLDAAYRHPGSQARPFDPKMPVNFRGTLFKATAEKARGLSSYDMYNDDYTQIMKSVRDGKEAAQLMILTMHCHEGPGGLGEDGLAPPDFLIQYARSAIDNGADMFAGTGPHPIRGIEIYKGKPIYYGLGSYAYMLNQTPAGYDRFRDNQQDPLTTDFTDRELTWAGWPENNDIMDGKPMDIAQEESILCETVYQDGKLVEIDITPLDLGNGKSMSELGIPHVASGAIAQDILKRLQRLSKPLGTNVVIKGDVAVIRVAANGRSE